MSGPFGSSQWMYASGDFYPKTINGSLRFNDDDSAYLTRTPSSASNRKTWTWSGWVKLANIGVNQVLFNAHQDSSNFFALALNSNKIFWYDINSGTDYGGFYSPKLRDSSAWYHIVLRWDTDTSWNTKLYLNGEDITSTFENTYGTPSTDYEAFVNTTNPHRIGYRQDASVYMDAYLAEVFFIDGTAHDADSFGETKNGIWVPKNITSSNFTMGTNGFHLTFEDDTTVEAFNTVLWEGNGGTQSVTGTGFSPDFVWIKNRDNADDHYLYDTVRGPNRFLGSNTTTAEDYSNNDVISFDSDGFTVGSDGGLNRSGQSIVAWCWDAGANNTITGHSSVTWEGKGADIRVSGLPFRPDLVWAKSTSNGTSHALFDSVRGAGKMLNSDTTVAEISDSQYGYLDSFDKDGFHFQVGSSDGTYGTFSGHEYVAWCWDAGDSDPVSNSNGSITSTVKASTTNGFSIVSYTGTGANATVGHGLSSPPDWIILRDRNNVNDWVVYHSGIGNTHAIKLNSSNASFDEATVFNDTSPTSTTFSLGSANLANNSSQAHIAYCWHDVAGKQKFGTYTGQGNVTLGFRPGFILIKNTTDASTDWVLYDASRNPLGGTAISRPNLSSADASETVTITANGFTTGTGSYVGASGKTYIYMAFAGSYPDFITNVNTDGTIDSRVKASTANGFSIVSYTGNGSNNSTVGHGLGAVPDWVLVTARDFGTATNWAVFHSALTSVQTYLRLNTTDAEVTSDNTNFGTVEPTSSVMNLGYAGSTNTNGNEYIMYCWTATAGRSAFGSYTGNGSATGPSITCGFAPALIILKRKDSGGSWTISDNTRDTVNPVTPFLFPAGSDVESTDGSNDIDFNSNGFQIKHDSRNNASGGTYIYMAFADTRDAAFWLDSSSNDNDFQHVHLDHNDTVSDSPTNSFCTLNPLDNYYLGATFSDGNLRIATNNYTYATTTIGMTSGKYYAEVLFESNSAAQMLCGITRVPSTGTTDYLGNSNGHISYYNIDGGKYLNGAARTSYGDSYTVGDVIGIAVDMDAGEIIFTKNGTSQGVITGAIDTSATYFYAGGDFSSANNNTMVWNFGQQPFNYDPPE